MKEDEQNVDRSQGDFSQVKIDKNPGDEEVPESGGSVPLHPRSELPDGAQNGPRSPLEDTHAPDPIRQLLTIAKRQEQTLWELSKLFERRLLYDQSKERAFDSLYQELADLKSGKHVQALKPILRDLLLIFDRIERASSEEDNGRVAELLSSFRDELLETLFRAGVDLIPTSETFNPRHQMAIGRKDTTQTDLSGRIAEVVRRGFRLEETLLRPEEVIVYNVVGPSEDTEERGGSTPDARSGSTGVDEKGAGSGSTT